MTKIILFISLGLQIAAFGQNLSGQVFILAEDFDEKECKVSAACDCCASDLFFLNAKEFRLVARCIYNDTYFKGTYTITNDKLVLSFNTKMVNEIVDEATFKVTNEIGKTTAEPMEFVITECEGQLKLENSINPGVKNGIQLTASIEKKKIKELKESAAWKLLFQF